MRVSEHQHSLDARPPQGAGSGLPQQRSLEPGPEHAVQFYESDAVLFSAAGSFFGPAIESGDAAVMVATLDHQVGIIAHLQATGFDVNGAIAAERFILLDAAETLATFMADGMPDPVRFETVIGGIIARAATGGRAVRVFGEMVNLLALEGNSAAAILLEKLWNQLQQRQAFDLLCAYDITQLGGAEFGNVVDEICAAHTHVIPAESYAALLNAGERDRAVAVLQQRARWLGLELAERRRTEERLRDALAAEQAAHAATEAALRVRGEFLTVAAHELRTPVSGLSLHAQLLLRRFRRGEVVDLSQIGRSLEAIDRQSTRLISFVDRLLDLSRLQAGKLALERQETDLADVVSHAVESITMPGDRERIAVLATDSLPACVDALRLEQVIANLLDNAVRHSGSDTRIEITLTAPTSDMAELAVRDYGPGIPTDKRARLFEQFFQAHGEGHLRGLGLGLYFSRQVVELHGGDISAEFPADRGTRILIRLPRQPPASA
jgi:signal transduction histidine kinase